MQNSRSNDDAVSLAIISLRIRLVLLTTLLWIYVMLMLHCRLHAARVDDFVGALKQLHVDFHWPFPVLSLSALQHVASGLLTP